jgi:hypothetical protein
VVLTFLLNVHVCVVQLFIMLFFNDLVYYDIFFLNGKIYNKRKKKFGLQHIQKRGVQEVPRTSMKKNDT